MADQLIRLDSYPFDSNTPTTYDERGYPIFDRGITSRILAACWKQFFSDGVFASPSTNLQITRGTGFSINIANGIGIIEGHMGGVFDTDGRGLDIKLTDSVRGTMVYSIMLRYDNNNEYRSNWIRVVEGASPATPEIAPSVKEFRLGYVTIPSNATSIEDAIITDERGTSVCPYAAPFEEIDIADVIGEAQRQAQVQLDYLANYITENKQYIDAAISGELAGEILSKINEVSEKLPDDEFKRYVFSDDQDETKSGKFATAGNIQSIFPLDGSNIEDNSIGSEQIDVSSLADNTTIVENDVGQLEVKSGAFAPVSGYLANVSGAFYDGIEVEATGHYMSKRYIFSNAIYDNYEPLVNVTDYASSIQSGFYASQLNIYSLNFPNLELIDQQALSSMVALHHLSAPQVSFVSFSALAGCSVLESISFPNLETIYSGAFRGCQSLSRAFLPKVKEIYAEAFMNCTSLQELELPMYDYSVSHSGWSTNSIFASCYALSKVSLPVATSIPSQMFQNCRNLEEIYMPNVQSISNAAFNNCYIDPHKVTWPLLNTSPFENTVIITSGFAGQWSRVFNAYKSITMSMAISVAASGFSGLNRFHELYLPNVTSISTTNAGAGTFVDSMLYVPQVTETWSANNWSTNFISMDGGTLVHGCDAIRYSSRTGWNGASIYILSNCSIINASAFLNHQSITGIQVKTLSQVNSSCFASCSNLEWIDIIDSDATLAYIGSHAFANCSQLSSIPFGDNIAGDIFNNAFSNCRSLKEIDAPNASGIVGSVAFAACINMQTVNLPKVTTIAGGAFNSCPNLTYVITGASTLGNSAFASAGRNTVCSIYLAYNGIVSNTSATDQAFSYYDNLQIYVPAAYYNQYMTNSNWSYISSCIYSF